MPTEERASPLPMRAAKMRLLRWWARHDMPRAVALLRRARVWDDKLWRGAGDGLCRGRWHGYRLRLDLSHYHQRGAFFYGRLLEMPVQLVLRAALAPGDVHLDIGAHVGITAMLAAWRVGAAGRVLAFEPNPEIAGRLRWHVEANGLRQVEVWQITLSDHGGVQALRVPTTGNTGAATLGELVARQRGPRSVEHSVELATGDAVLAGIDLPDRPMFIKMDVEGHEVAGLRGLHATLEAHRPAVLLECNTEMLPQSGASVDELFGFMHGLGYETFVPSARWQRLRRRFRLELQRRPGAWRPSRTRDILFLQPGGVHAGRLARAVR